MKTLFTIQPHSIVDVITNSSSELFVGKASSKDDIIALIEEVYPNYMDEYAPLKSLSELNVDELNSYFSYMCSPHCWPARKSQYPVLPGFTFDELYEARETAWNGEIQYELRDNDNSYSYVTESNVNEIKEKLRKGSGELFFLWSLDDNPNWDKQEMLESIMTRIHLG